MASLRERTQEHHGQKQHTAPHRLAEDTRQLVAAGIQQILKPGIQIHPSHSISGAVLARRLCQFVQPQHLGLLVQYVLR